MTIPQFSDGVRRKLSDFVRDLLSSPRGVQFTPDEMTVGVSLSANPVFATALRNVIQSRIAGRASVPEPTDLLVCKSMVARDRELQWLLRRLEELSLASASQPGTNGGEPPA